MSGRSQRQGRRRRRRWYPRRSVSRDPRSSEAACRSELASGTVAATALVSTSEWFNESLVVGGGVYVGASVGDRGGDGVGPHVGMLRGFLGRRRRRGGRNSRRGRRRRQHWYPRRSVSRDHRSSEAACRSELVSGTVVATALGSKSECVGGYSVVGGCVRIEASVGDDGGDGVCIQSERVEGSSVDGGGV